MAVCGCCWVCGAKFSCGSTPCNSCGTPDRRPVRVELNSEEEPWWICRDCVERIESRVVSDVLDAIDGILSLKSKSKSKPVDACPTCKVPVEDLVADHVDDCLPIANPPPAGPPCVRCGKDARGAVFVQLCDECLPTNSWRCSTCGTSARVVREWLDAPGPMGLACAECDRFLKEEQSRIGVRQAPSIPRGVQPPPPPLEPCKSCGSLVGHHLWCEKSEPRVRVNCLECGKYLDHLRSGYVCEECKRKNAKRAAPPAAQPATKVELAAPCPACQGQGEVTTFPGDGHVRPIKRICTACKGTGLRGP